MYKSGNHALSRQRRQKGFVDSHSYQVNPVPEMIHSVLVIFTAVATPLAASEREPVVPVPARRIVSVVIAMVMTPAPFWLMNVTAVPTGNATEPFAGIVNVLAVVSAEGWKICLPESARTSV